MKWRNYSGSLATAEGQRGELQPQYYNSGLTSVQIQQRINNSGIRAVEIQQRMIASLENKIASCTGGGGVKYRRRWRFVQAQQPLQAYVFVLHLSRVECVVRIMYDISLRVVVCTEHNTEL